MSDSLEHVRLLEPTSRLEGTWITLLYARSVPPHIILINNGMCFSLEHDGYCTYTVDSLLRLVAGKCIESVFFKIKSVPEFDAEPNFQRYGSLFREVTCLYPIRDICAAYLTRDCEDCMYVFQLIPLLITRGFIDSVYHRNLGDGDVSYRFPVYSKKEIFERISELQK